ncbi:MAG: recombination-associated protein RdgC [Gammaproteobacteria bacterium]|nr:recombination-associated protein RdgC [Gammaproteobacteria bacterium]
MWFKNLQLYRFTKPFDLDAEALADALDAHRFRPCGSQDMMTMGFVPALGDALVHSAHGYQLLSLKKEERILPGAVIREWVENKADEIAQREARKVGRKERANLKDEAILALMPRAFTRSGITRAYISPDGWLVVDAGSAKRAEDFMSKLREAVGSLPVLPLQVAAAPSAVMTAWLKGEEAVPEDFLVGEETELIDPAEDGGIVRCRRQDLAAEEIQGHLAAGKQVVKLALSWNEAMNFVLTNEPSVKRLRFTDLVQEQMAYLDGADAQALFDGQFALMTLELSRLLPRLVEVLGGEAQAA